MTIDISSTALYITGAIILVAVITYVVVNVFGKSSNNTIAQSIDTNNNEIDIKPSNNSEWQERKRRQKAVKEIEARLNKELSIQSNMIKDYVQNLVLKIKPIEKKIFYNITRLSETNPSGLFDKLRRIFDLKSNSTIYFCRRNNTAFGADDFFIISEKGFSFGDSNGENWTIGFDELVKINDIGYHVDFDCYDESISQCIDWENILYYSDDKQKSDFLEVTNNFLNRYETVEDVYERAARRALSQRALPLLKTLTDKIGTDNLQGKYIRAGYYYTLAADNVNANHNLEQCRYLLSEIESTLEKWAKEDNRDVRGHSLYGDCKFLEARVAWRSGEDEYVIQQTLKDLQGKEYNEEIREAARGMYGKMVHNK